MTYPIFYEKGEDENIFDWLNAVEQNSRPKPKQTEKPIPTVVKLEAPKGWILVKEPPEEEKETPK